MKLKVLEILLLYLILLINLTSSNTLKQIHVLFRHGERSPTETFINDPHKNFEWSGGWGHLTNRGKNQIYTLGQTLKQVYAEFLPEYYFPNEFKVFSSYADRCLMSAQLINAGLYPPKNQEVWNKNLLWQPIPVQYMPRSQDNFIAMKQDCPKYDKALQEILHQSEKVININKDNYELFQHLSDHTGMKVDNIGIVETLFNTLEIEKLNNLTLPVWINDTLMATMKKLGAQNLALYSETEYMKRMKGGVLVKKILISMKKIIKQSEPKVFLYSGHDLTIVNVLRTLNLVDTIKPSFGASIIFELHEDSLIKLLYRNAWDEDPEDYTSKACTIPCKLESFMEKFKTVLPSDWDEECKY